MDHVYNFKYMYILFFLGWIIKANISCKVLVLGKKYLVKEVFALGV